MARKPKIDGGIHESDTQAAIRIARRAHRLLQEGDPARRELYRRMRFHAKSLVEICTGLTFSDDGDLIAAPASESGSAPSEGSKPSLYPCNSIAQLVTDDDVPTLHGAAIVTDPNLPRHHPGVYMAPLTRATRTKVRR